MFVLVEKKKDLPNERNNMIHWQLYMFKNYILFRYSFYF